jgi:NAD(P)-dependent dehydrogenase (short-subunit alcohol dehydrogenase family)
MGLLDGKVAIVTGAGRPTGIGEATALKLAREGADVAVTDICRSYEGDLAWYPLGEAEGLRSVAEAIEGLGRRAAAVEADLTRRDEVEALVDATLSKFGRLDILVNNAGSAVGTGEFLAISESAWNKTFDVNVKGTFHCMRAAIPHMLKGGGGRIVNVSSTSGLRGAPLFGAYDASKFAVVGMTQTVAAEFAPQNIVVNCVCPGSVDTQLSRDADDFYSRSYDVSPDEVREMDRKRIPLGRTASGEDIANVILFLVSPLNTYVVGQAVRVDGGRELTGEIY